MVLQFAAGISFFDTLWLNNLIIAVGAIVSVLVYLDYARSLRHLKHRDYLFLFNGILILGGFADVILYLVLPYQVVPIGTATALTFLAYAMLAHVVLVHQEVSTAIEKNRLSLSYNKYQTVGLMHQIKAHFIFNTLNAISALCKQDAHKADLAVKLFARYLRAYMNLINQEENIDFLQELNLVQAYLDIEKLRFETGFSFDIQTDFVNFKVPPLSIQPMVENAVVHGLRQTAHPGTITLHSTRVGDWARVTVTDNGAGFDPSILKKDPSVGLSNLQKRVEILCNGQVLIRSTPGHGTQITLLVPIEK